jgi:hypothetical protein
LALAPARSALRLAAQSNSRPWWVTIREKPEVKIYASGFLACDFIDMF